MEHYAVTGASSLSEAVFLASGAADPAARDAGENASAQAAAFLNRYDIGQNPISVTDNESITIIADYRDDKSG